MYYTNEMTITMKNAQACETAMAAIKSALVENAERFNQQYAYNATTRFANSLVILENKIVVENGEVGAFTPEDMPEVIKTIAQAIAANSDKFEIHDYDSCDYSEGDTTISFDGKALTIKSTYFPCGVVEFLSCPECGEDIVSIEEYDPNVTYVCPECGEEIDLSEQYEESAPVITKEVIKIK